MFKPFVIIQDAFWDIICWSRRIIRFVRGLAGLPAYIEYKGASLKFLLTREKAPIVLQSGKYEPFNKILFWQSQQLFPILISLDIVTGNSFSISFVW